MSCQINVDKKSDESTSNSSHIGAWEMINFRAVNGKDTTEIENNQNPLAKTLLTPTHFSYQWRNSANSGSGTYTYDGTLIHQRFEFLRDSSFVGATLSFNMEVRNDTLFFSGPVKAQSASGKNLMNQLPQMLEIRRRVK